MDLQKDLFDGLASEACWFGLHWNRSVCTICLLLPIHGIDLFSALPLVSVCSERSKLTHPPTKASEAWNVSLFLLPLRDGQNEEGAAEKVQGWHVQQRVLRAHMAGALRDSSLQRVLRNLFSNFRIQISDQRAQSKVD